MKGKIRSCQKRIDFQMVKEKIIVDEGIEFILDDEIESNEKGKSAPPNLLPR